MADAPQDHVPGLRPWVFVDALEMVQVEHEQA
jgi:hypothetical protein